MKTINSEILKQLVLRANPLANMPAITPEFNLLNSRTLDSLTIVQLILEIESEFQIVFDFDDLRAPYFETLSSLEKMLIEKYSFQHGD